MVAAASPVSNRRSFAGQVGDLAKFGPGVRHAAASCAAGTPGGDARKHCDSAKGGMLVEQGGAIAAELEPGHQVLASAARPMVSTART
jgi:hypothetical protein